MVFRFVLGNNLITCRLFKWMHGWIFSWFISTSDGHTGHPLAFFTSKCVFHSSCSFFRFCSFKCSQHKRWIKCLSLLRPSLSLSLLCQLTGKWMDDFCHLNNDHIEQWHCIQKERPRIAKGRKRGHFNHEWISCWERVRERERENRKAC